MSLPQGWINITLEKLGKWGSGGTPKRTNPLYYDNGEIPWLIISDLNDGIVIESASKITQEGLMNSSAKLIPEGALLVAMYGSIGKLGITGIECTTNQAIAFCVPNTTIVDLYYLFYLLMNSKHKLIQQGKGGTQQNISQTVLKGFTIPLAPLNEQKRIAEKLEQLLARVDKVKDKLEGIEKIIITYRTSMLKTAISGEMTRYWQGHKAFQCVKLGEIAKWSSGGTPSRKNLEYYGGSIPWVKTGELRENIILQTEETLTEEGVRNSSAKLFPVGTVLVAMYGATIGRVAILGVEATTNQACAAAMVDSQKVSKNYLYYLMQAEKNLLIAKGKGGAQPNISQTVIKQHKVYLPALEEQHEIVRRVEHLLTLADTLEQHYQQAKQKVDKLTAAILAKAFRGELVPQDPNDEPAEKLLERIQAERQAQQEKEKAAKKAKRKRKKAL